MKPKLLFVSAISPFPTDSGGSVRTWHTLNNLSKYFSIYFISFKSSAYKLSETEKKWLKEKTVFYHFMDLVDQRKVGDFFSNGQPFWFTPWYNDELKLIVHDLVIKEKIEKIQIDFTQLLYLFDCLPKQSRKIFIAHDISTVSFARRAMETKKLKHHIVFLGLCWQIWWYEKQYLSKYDLVIAMSQNDAQILKENFNAKNVLVVPNGIDKIKKIGKINKSNKSSFDLGYIGAFSHPPNEEAIKFFITKIAPILEKNNFDYNFYYAGKNDVQKFQQFVKEAQLKQPERIINLGFVEKTEEFYQQIDCLITPIFSGSGTRLKILEALGFGLPVISSTIGAEGIDLDSAQLKIANEPEEFYQKIVETKKENQKEITYDSQKIMEKYLWENIFGGYAQEIIKKIN